MLDSDIPPRYIWGVDNNLKELRRAKGIRQEDIEAKTGISQPMISAVENGHIKRLPLDTARTLADAIGESVDDVFPVDPEPVAQGA